MIKIAIDGRVLQTEPYTGVSYYLQNILSSWKAEGIGKEVRLYFNQGGSWTPPDSIRNYYDYSLTRVPNKALQFLWSVSSKPSIDRAVKEGTIWLPNSNFLPTIEDKKYLVLSIHDLSFIHFPEFYSRKMQLWHKLLSVEKLIKRSNHVITFSAASKQDIVERFSKRESDISIVPHGVSEAFYGRAVEGDNLNLPERYICFIGSLEPRKNVGTLIEAFELLAEKYSEIHLVLAGSKGWLSKPTFKKIQQSRYANRIRYMGYVTEGEKLILLKKAVVFAFPSFYEGYGLPVLEAMASGTPVVVGATGSLPELVSDTGILINPHQTHELAGAIDALLSNSSLASKFSAAAISRARKYTWEASAKTTMELLSMKI